MRDAPNRLWIADMARGDAADREEVFVRLWETYQPRLACYLALSFPGGPADREDRVQEIFMKMFEKLDTYNPAFSFSTWFFRIARNHCIDAGRARRLPRREIDPDDFASARPGPEEALLEAETRDIIGAWLEQLPDEDRELCFLRFFEGLKYRQLAGLLHQPVGTVKYRLHRLKKELRLALEEPHGYKH